jgi:hypothetical protein
VLSLPEDTFAPTRQMILIWAELEYLERDSYSSFVMPDQHSRFHCSFILKSNIPGIHACNSLYICTLLCSVSLF